MGFIIIDKIKNNNKKIMIFTEGTILKPKNNNFFSRIAMTKYIPIKNSIETLKKWQEEGYEVIYLTSLKAKGAMRMAQRLDELGFTGSMVGYRQKNQDYATLIKEELPDILIEDNAKSVGGHMCYDELSDEIKKQIKHIVVEEFDGIDDVKLYEDRNIIFKDEQISKVEKLKENITIKSKNKKKNKKQKSKEA